MPDLAAQALGYCLLALVVVGYLRWEWISSENFRAQRRENEQQIEEFKRQAGA